MPDPESAQVKCTVTGPATMPLAFGAGESAALMTGAVLSMFSVTLAVALLPALSIAVPDTSWFAPSALTTMVAGQVAMPEPLSEQVNDTLTVVLFQPFKLAGGAASAVIVGGVVSAASSAAI